MNIFSAYTKGFKESIKYPGMIGILYAFNIISGLIVAAPFFNILTEGFGQSMIGNELSTGFNFTSVMEFFQNNSNSFSGIVSQLKWTAILYLIVNTLFVGGILRTLNKQTYTISQFFAGAGYYFFRFFYLTLIMMLIHFLVALLVYIPTFITIGGISDSVESEKTFFVVFFVGFTIHLLLLFYMMMVSDYAKLYLMLNDSKRVFKGLFESFKFTTRNSYKTYPLFLMLLVIPAIIFYLYLNLDRDIGMKTFAGIVLMFVVQQLFIFLRIGFRVWSLSSQLHFYGDEFIKQEKIKNVKARLNEWENQAELVIKKEQALQNISFIAGSPMMHSENTGEIIEQEKHIDTTVQETEKIEPENLQINQTSTVESVEEIINNPVQVENNPPEQVVEVENTISNQENNDELTIANQPEEENVDNQKENSENKEAGGIQED